METDEAVTNHDVTETILPVATTMTDEVLCEVETGISEAETMIVPRDVIMAMIEHLDVTMIEDLPDATMTEEMMNHAGRDAIMTEMALLEGKLAFIFSSKAVSACWSNCHCAGSNLHVDGKCC